MLNLCAKFQCGHFGQLPSKLVDMAFNNRWSSYVTCRCGQLYLKRRLMWIDVSVISGGNMKTWSVLCQCYACGVQWSWYWLLQSDVNLVELKLTSNNLSDAFDLPSLSNPVHMYQFDASAALIDGAPPSHIGSILPNLQYLNLSKN